MSSTIDEIIAFLAFKRTSGIPLIFREYQQFNVDPAMASGFLSAMLSFAQEAQLSDLKQVDMADLRFFFISHEEVVFSILVTRFISPQDLEFKLNMVKSLFLEEFGEEDLKIVSTDSSTFKDFNKIVDEIILGETRGIDPSVKAAVREVIDDTLIDSEITGLAVLSLTGNVIVNRFKESQKSLLEATIRFLDATYVGQIHGLKYMILGSEDHSIIILDCGKGLMLVGSSTSEVSSDALSESLNEIAEKMITALGE